MKRIKHLLLVSAILFVVEMSVILTATWMLGEIRPLRINNWIALEWLINYEGGFIRRGLAGELIRYLSAGGSTIHWVHRLPLYLYLAYCVTLLGTYAMGRVRNLKVLLLGLIIPGGLWHMALGQTFFTRKEMVFLVLFALLCGIYLASLRAAPAVKRFWLALFAVLSIAGGVAAELIHEGYLIMGVPITSLLYWVIIKENPSSKLMRYSWFVYTALMGLFFGVSVLYHGSPEIAQAMWDALPLADRVVLVPSAPYTVFGTISGVGWGMRQHLSTLYGVFVSGGFGYWILFAVGNTAVLSYIVMLMANVQPYRFQGNFPRLIGLGFILSTGMFLVGSDWGRWLAIACNQTILLAFALNQSPYALAMKQGTCMAADCVNSRWMRKTGAWLLTLPAFVMLSVYSTLFDMPMCCVHFEKIFVKYHMWFKVVSGVLNNG